MNPRDFNSPNVLFRPQIQEFIFDNFIQPKVHDFLKARDVNIGDVIKVENRFSITDLNFQSIGINYFYNRLLKGIKKENDIIRSVFYTITYDKNLAILECKETGLAYNEMYLGKKPILYFIYFDLQEIFDVVREKSKEYKTY